MDKQIIKKLCQSGAFNAFIEILDSLNEPEIEHSDTDIKYTIGKRDGYRELKSELKNTIHNLAQQ